jgi:hypothetical protein
MKCVQEKVHLAECASPAPSGEDGRAYRHSAIQGKRPSKPSTASNLLRYLHEHIDSLLYVLPDAELEWLAGCGDQAQLMAQNLGGTLGHLASLVGSDLHNETEKSGALQPDGIDELLYHAAETILTIDSMANIASTAEWALRDRWEQRARDLGFKHADAEEKHNG